jgi:RNA polymerase sigma-70 factor (ECF subfamily)
LPENRVSEDEVRQLYDRHSPALMLYARTFVADSAAAEDVVHGVFLKLLGGRPIALQSPLAYLYRAVKNAALNAKRDRSREVPLLEDVAWLSRRNSEPEAVLALQQGLQDLAEEQREAVIMRIWSGMTLDEIAAATGVPLNTIASRYRYALEKLRERLKPYEKRARSEEL